ncbi:MAG: hypothetical protein E2P02_28380 [Acidobacteria bacterium]|nr:MAG: hypothetical protein E2P02_28380 [Acidobacteriota bacterium]
MADGPIPVEDALPVARQIAEALEAGHEAGVIHRDVKPANVKLRADGVVKVLDYGLAKALEGNDGRRSERELSQSPTSLTRAMTASWFASSMRSRHESSTERRMPPILSGPWTAIRSATSTRGRLVGASSDPGSRGRLANARTCNLPALWRRVVPSGVHFHALGGWASAHR